MPRPAPFGRAFAVGALTFALATAGCLDKASEHRLRANAFLRGNDAASALSECDLGLAIRRDDVPLMILRGNALFELDRLDEARTAYAHAIEAGASDGPKALAEAHLGLAMAAARQRDWAVARREFTTLVTVNDRDATSQLNVARACLELADMPCALEHGEIAARLRGNEENVLFTLGTIYLAAGQAADAEKTFRHIGEVVPRAASCPYGLALVAAKAGNKDDAIADLEKAVDLKLPNPGRIAEEAGFAGLHDDTRFAALVTKAAAATK